MRPRRVCCGLCGAAPGRASGAAKAILLSLRTGVDAAEVVDAADRSQRGGSDEGEAPASERRRRSRWRRSRRRWGRQPPREQIRRLSRNGVSLTLCRRGRICPQWVDDAHSCPQNGRRGMDDVDCGGVAAGVDDVADEVVGGESRGVAGRPRELTHCGEPAAITSCSAFSSTMYVCSCS